MTPTIHAPCMIDDPLMLMSEPTDVTISYVVDCSLGIDELSAR